MTENRDPFDWRLTIWEQIAWTVVMLGAVWAALVSALVLSKGNGLSAIFALTAIVFGLFVIWGDAFIRKGIIQMFLTLVILGVAGASLYGFIWSATNVSDHIWDS